MSTHMFGDRPTDFPGAGTPIPAWVYPVFNVTRSRLEDWGLKVTVVDGDCTITNQEEDHVHHVTRSMSGLLGFRDGYYAAKQGGTK